MDDYLAAWPYWNYKQCCELTHSLLAILPKNVF